MGDELWAKFPHSKDFGLNTNTLHTRTQTEPKLRVIISVIEKVNYDINMLISLQ